MPCNNTCAGIGHFCSSPEIRGWSDGPPGWLFEGLYIGYAVFSCLYRRDTLHRTAHIPNTPCFQPAPCCQIKTERIRQTCSGLLYQVSQGCRYKDRLPRVLRQSVYHCIWDIPGILLSSIKTVLSKDI